MIFDKIDLLTYFIENRGIVQKNKYTFLDAAKRSFKKLNYPENSRKLMWKEIEKLGLDKKIGSNGKTPWATLNAQLCKC